MEKRKITAREVLKDIRSGASDSELMKKYSLSAQGLQSIFDKLLRAGVITKTEIEERVPMSERTADLGFICPACGNIQNKEFMTCPRCGFEVLGRKRAERNGNSSKAGVTEHADHLPANPKKRSAPLHEKTPPRSTSGRANGEGVQNLKKMVKYCRVLSVAGFLAYLFVSVAFVVLYQGSAKPELGQLLLSVIVLTIPTTVVAFILLVLLRALSESLSIFVDLTSAVGENQR